MKLVEFTHYFSNQKIAINPECVAFVRSVQVDEETTATNIHCLSRKPDKSAWTVKEDYEVVTAMLSDRALH